MGLASFNRSRRMKAEDEGVEKSTTHIPGMNTRETIDDQLKAGMPAQSPQTVTEMETDGDRQGEMMPVASVVMEGSRVVDTRPVPDDVTGYGADVYAPPASTVAGTDGEVKPLEAGAFADDASRYTADDFAPPSSVDAGTGAPAEPVAKDADGMPIETLKADAAPRAMPQDVSPPIEGITQDAPPAGNAEMNAMTKAELLAHASARGADLDGRLGKAKLIEQIAALNG